MASNSAVENISQPDLAWFTRKKYFFLLTLLVPMFPIYSAYMALEYGNGAWLWFTAVINFVVVPIADAIFGADPHNPTQEQEVELKDDRFYVWIMYAATIGHWLAVIAMTYAVATMSLAWYNYLGAILSIGAMHAIGLTMSHELGHRTNDKGQVWAAKIVIACSGYGHFNIEHNRGHHKHVATPEDPASARMGENLYKFACRELPGAFFRACALETERLNKKGYSFWSIHNDIFHSWAITIVAFTTMVYFFGLAALPFLIITSFYGWFQLTMANYIEHYGLLRQKLPNGNYQKCEPIHSWNSNFRVSNLLSLHLQRHSDHHANASRPYQLLRDFEGVPCMPTGYPTMMMLSTMPPLWYRLMDKKVVDWAKGDMNLVNMDASARDRLFSRYHNPWNQSGESLETTAA